MSRFGISNKTFRNFGDVLFDMNSEDEDTVALDGGGRVDGWAAAEGSLGINALPVGLSKPYYNTLLNGRKVLSTADTTDHTLQHDIADTGAIGDSTLIIVGQFLTAAYNNTLFDCRDAGAYGSRMRYRVNSVVTNTELVINGVSNRTLPGMGSAPHVFIHSFRNSDNHNLWAANGVMEHDIIDAWAGPIIRSVTIFGDAQPDRGNFSHALIGRCVMMNTFFGRSAIKSFSNMLMEHWNL